MIGMFTAVLAHTFRHDDNGATRVTRPTKVASPAEFKQHVRVHEEVGFSDLPSRLANEFLGDPVVLTCSLFFIAYVVGQMVTTRKHAAKGKPLIEEASRRPHRRNKFSKSHVAIAMNQQIIALQSPEDVLEFIIARQKSADIVNVVTAIHRCAKLSLETRNRNHNISGDPRIRELLAQLLAFLDDSDLPASIISRAVGNTSWALAKLSFVVTTADEVVLDRLQQLFTEHAQHFRPEEVMNTVWAFTTLGGEMKKEQDRAALIAVGVLKCSARFHEFTLQQVVYFAWALARLLGFASVRAREDVMQGLELYKKQILETVGRAPQALTSKNISMVSWAITHLHQRIDSKDSDVRTVLVTVTSEAVRRELRQFCPGELASIIWALNKCNVKHMEFLDLFKKHVLQTGLSTYSSQDLANIVVTYVNLAPADDFLSVLGEAVQKTAGNFNRLERAMVMAAFQQVPHITLPRFP